MKKSWQDMAAEAASYGVTDIHIEETGRMYWRLGKKVIPSDEAEGEAVLNWFDEFTAAGPGLDRMEAIGKLVCRIHVYETVAGRAAAIRLLHPYRPLEEDQDREILKQCCLYPSGLVLITGSTGAGKTTLLHRMIDYVNRQEHKHIVTVEDPVEWIHTSQKSLVSQREVGRHVPSYPAAVKEALREDPDVLLIGELREEEAADCVLEAAETGHLVLATLHTGRAAEVIPRMIQAGTGNPEYRRERLAQCLRAVITQQAEYKDGERKHRRDILINTPEVSQLIRSHKEHQLYNAMQTGRSWGMRVMEQEDTL